MSAPDSSAEGQGDPRRMARPQSIPLQNLQTAATSQAQGQTRFGASLGVSTSGGGRALPTSAQMATRSPDTPSFWDDSYPSENSNVSGSASPIDPLALQYALPPNIRTRAAPAPSAVPGIMGIAPSDNPYPPETPFYEEHAETDSLESDSVPLKPAAQPIGKLDRKEAETQPRYSFNAGGDMGGIPARTRNTQMLGHNLEAGFSADRNRNYGDTLAPGRRRSRSPSTSGALSRAGSIMRAVSQRVVMIGGETDLPEPMAQRDQSRSRSPGSELPQRGPETGIADTSYASQTFRSSPEKGGDPAFTYSEPEPAPRLRPRRARAPNPLKGKSLGIFGPENPIRKILCNALVHPLTEPSVLILIVLQAILLAVESAPDVFVPGNERPERWGSTRIDWAIFALFVIFTVELLAKIIVSGLIMNAPEYTDDGKKRVQERIAEQYRTIFQPHRQRSVMQPRQEQYVPTAFARTFTFVQGQMPPSTFDELQRLQLARRAFLRHGFNRLDFVAVFAFWVSFTLGITGTETGHHLYVFRMLSCLRIIRLLALTKGNLIILRSLKKAAPLLVRVSFLIGFFWLVFAIIGVQSFKSSLSRQCTWLNPEDPTNLTSTYKRDFSFCGGYINATDNKTEPWVYMTEPGNLSVVKRGAETGKGFICPRGSLCLQGDNPYNGTVHFDDIVHSLELVFVIMSANTFSDLMYWTMSSDYLPAALFFGFGIMFMMLWMTNLLIAVITSSFQVIREESKASAFAAEEHALDEDTAEEPPRKASRLQAIYQKTSVLWIVIIAFGLFCQATRSATMSARRERFINTAEMAVTGLLDLEIIFRIAGDFHGFWKRSRDLADLGLAVVTTVILIPLIRNSGQPYAWLTVFQIVRVYRIVLAVPMTRDLIVLVLGNVTGIGNLMLFVFLMTFLVAIFAAQLFRGELPYADEGGEEIRVPFNTIYNSFLGMYQILSTENWTDVLYNVTAFTNAIDTAWVGAVFLIAWFIVAYFILVNMFIAVIQENFDVGEDVKRLEQVRAFLQRKELGASSGNLALSKVFGFGRSRRRRDPLDYGPATMEMLLKEAVVREFLDDALDPLQHAAANGADGQTLFRDGVKPGFFSNIWGKLVALFSSREPNPFYSNIMFEASRSDTVDPREMAKQAVNATANRRKAQRDYLHRHPTYNVSLYLFKPKNPLRRLCQSMVGPGRGSERFDGLMPNKYAWYIFSGLTYAAIVAMVVLACVTTPLYQKHYFERHPFSILNWFVWTDLAFACVFSIEAVIKIIADGFLWTPNAYFRSSWGIIDAVVLTTLWINVVTLFTNDGAVSRAVGAFKALRALRLLNVSDSARDTFHSLIIMGSWKILSAAFVSLSLLLPFAIYAVNVFNGQLVKCNDGNGITDLVDCQGEFMSKPFHSNWTVLAPRAASNPPFDFDDFGSSAFILFQIVSQEGWIDVSYAVQAITGKGQQPEFGHAKGNALFFVMFNLLATVFILTLFISVFMRNYTVQTGVAFLTAEQRSWLELRKLLRQISPSKSACDESKNRWKKWCHKRAIEKRGKWYMGITTVLVLHLCLLLSEFYTEPLWWTWARDVLFLVFTLIYITNIAIRIVGLSWARFRKSSWDVYALIIVSGTFATSVLFLSNTHFDTYVQLHKFFLVGIVLLLIPRNDALDQLFKTAAASLTTIGNLVATWLIFFLVFAIAMTQTFSLTRFGEEENTNENLRTVPNALVMLFKMSCGESWNANMEDFAQMQAPNCVNSKDFFESDCGSAPWARVLFVAWNIISMYIFVNLFVSLIYESFSYVYQRTAGLAVVDRDELRRFKEAWRTVDQGGTGFISKEAFPRLLGELSGVFEMRIYEPEESVRRILEDVQGQDTAMARHRSVASTYQHNTGGIDLAKLNRRLMALDVNKVRARRRRFNIFYEEVMISADPERGISFTTVLMIIAHYNIISDSKSLRLEEFLRRRARLQRVEEEVRRRVVLGFFDMLYYSRQFKRHMECKRAARMAVVPQLGVPEILVDNEEERTNTRRKRAATTANTRDRKNLFSDASASRANSSSSLLSTEDARNHHRTPSSASADVTTLLDPGAGGHPLAAPRALGNSFDAPPSPAAHGTRQRDGGAFSFEVQSDGQNDGLAPLRSGPASGPSSRRGSSVSPAQVREMLDDSVWMASIRRSTTMRRGQSLRRRGDWSSGG